MIPIERRILVDRLRELLVMIQQVADDFDGGSGFCDHVADEAAIVLPEAIRELEQPR